ncbi:MAG: T9SS type A sorting domain-containing protein [Saprospiraceae bacterium]|nr:T9SS type A sorting domain-containing protein [Saprospiraceae bacterium]
MNRTLYIFFFIICFIFQVSANHTVGATSQYKVQNLSNGTFNLTGTFVLYRDNYSTGAQVDNTIEIGIYKYTNNAWEWVKTLSDVPITTLSRIEDQKKNGFCQNILRNIQRVEYNFSVVLPEINGEYLFAHQRCCRVNNITNIINPNIEGIAVHFTLSEQGQKVNNTSPMLNRDIGDILQVGQSDTINYGHTDEDLTDIHKYTMISPFIAGGTDGSTSPGDPNSCYGVLPRPSDCFPPFNQLLYVSGFSAAFPFGDSTPFSLDENTGEIKVTPALQGIYQIGIKVEEFRNGQLLSTKYVDIQAAVSVEDVPAYITYGNRFYDKNNNGIKDTDELNIDIPLKLDKEYCSLVFEEDGTWKSKLYVDSFYHISSSDSLWVINTLNGSLPLISAASSDSLLTDIPLIPSNFILPRTDASLYLINPRCNIENTLYANVTNSGNEKLNIKVILKVDKLTKIISASHNPIVTDSTLIWENIVLDLAEFKNFEVMLQMPDENSTGVEMKFILQIEDVNNNNQVLDIVSYTTLVRCSFDPNDKISNPERGIQKLTKHDEYIYYTIRFQNQGNDYANDVFIKDQISSLLDIKTFTILQSSHDYKAMLSRTGTLLIKYENIKLIDKTSNEPESHGFFVFKIKPVQNLPEGTQIFNFAEIVFDKNQAIYTPAIFNTISYNIPSDTIYTIDVTNHPSQINLVPNPIHEGYFKIIHKNKSANEDIRVHIFSSTGHLIKDISTGYFRDIDILAFPSGLYIVSVYKDNMLMESFKIIKTNK